MAETPAELANLARIGNLAEYEGTFEADEQLLHSLIETAEKVWQGAQALPKRPGPTIQE